MATDDDDRVTPRLPAPDAVIRRTLEGLRIVLEAAPADARVRAMLSKVESYSRTVERWETIPPSEAQRGALTDLVEELRLQVDRDEPAPSSVRVGRVALRGKPPS